MVPRGLSDRLQRVKRWVRGRRATVAVVVAISAPLLIAATGLSLDAGYWYQQQENLQIAADAGAFAAANAEFSNPTTITTAPAGLPYAQSAANNATNGKYNLNGTGGGTITLTITNNVTAPANGTQWQATASAPRAIFFSGVRGPGLGGFGLGTQSATAYAFYGGVASAGACLFTTGKTGTDIATTGGSAVISATDCGFYSASTSCGGNNSISATNGTNIYGKTVTYASGGCVYADTNGGGSFVGTTAQFNAGTTRSTTGNGATASTTPPAIPGALASGASLPAAPTMQAAPALATNLPNGTAFTSGTPNYVSAQTGFNYSSLTNGGNGATAIWIGTTTNTGTTLAATGTTEVGSISCTNGSNCSTVNFGGANVYLTGSVNLAFPNNAGGAVNFNSTMNSIASGLSFQNSSGSTINLGAGTYYFGTGNTALSMGNSETLNTKPLSTTYFDGSFGTSNGNTWNFASNSMYMFKDNFSAFSGTYTFGDSTGTGGTYYFENGLYMVNSNTNVTFKPGIYYILNSILWLKGSGTLVGHGVTFVLEGTSSFILDSNGQSINLAAPDDLTTANASTLVNGTSTPANDPNYDPNCVEPSNFPLSTYTTTSTTAGVAGMPIGWPYDGSDGHGICGVLIYQDPSDTSADSIPATASLTGIIYAPGASLTLQNGTVATGSAAGTSGTLEIVSKTISNPNATLKLSAGNTGGVGGGGGGTTLPIALLTR